jgi:hypothetical protein
MVGWSGSPVRWVTHAVGPRWCDGKHSERELLASAYRNRMRLADEQQLRSGDRRRRGQPGSGGRIVRRTRRLRVLDPNTYRVYHAAVRVEQGEPAV